jgi:hypothetical protein
VNKAEEITAPATMMIGEIKKSRTQMARRAAANRGHGKRRMASAVRDTKSRP